MNGSGMNHPKFLKGASSVANLRQGTAGNHNRFTENGDDDLTNLHNQNMSLQDFTDPAQNAYQ